MAGLKLGWIVPGWALLFAVSPPPAAEASQESALKSDVLSSVADMDAANLAAVCAGSAIDTWSDSFPETCSRARTAVAVFGAEDTGLIGPTLAKADRLPAFTVGATPNGSARFDVEFWSVVPMAPAIGGDAPKVPSRSC